MDGDNVIVIYDDDDDAKVSEDRNQSNDFCDSVNMDQKTGITEFEDDADGNNYDLYEDQYEEGNEFNKEEEGYSGEDEEYPWEGGQYSPESGTSRKSKSCGTANRNKLEINENVEQTENEISEDDLVIANSHLQEIVDIKNQIRELQDILHDKSSSSERLKVHETADDDNDLRPLRNKLKARSAVRGIGLNRTSATKLDLKRKAKLEKNLLFKRLTNNMPFSSERLEERVVSSTMEKLEKKRRPKRNEIAEDELTGMQYSGFPQHFQKKKMPVESLKIRPEKKVKTFNEDIASEDIIDTKLQEIENIPITVTNSLRKILQMTANTPEEKYKVLDARDKLYKIMRDRDPSLKVGALVGTCPDMCPEKERLQREFQFQVSIFEMINYPKNTNLNHSHAVKQYCRSSADQEEPLPHELRPVNVLTRTMSYLLHNIADHCELSDENVEEWYMFMWDRTRAIRKELTQQGVCSLDTVKLVEQCARFHIHCAERLVNQDSSVYDDKINTENLTKCLQTLKYMYRDLANEDICCENESEFVCYSLLLNLNNASVFTELGDMSDRLMSSEPVQFALDVMTAWETRNYVRFFNLVERTTYLNCCILRRYFNEMRLNATKTMIRSYCTKYISPQISIYRFIDSLHFESIEDCCNFLEHCNFEVNQTGDSIYVNFNRLSFRNPEHPFPTGRAYATIEGKKRRPLSVVMAGGELPPKTYLNHVPQNSFSLNGELKLDSLLCKDLMEFANGSSAAQSLPTSAQTQKNKLFETKPGKETSGSPFTDIFGKQKPFGIAPPSDKIRFDSDQKSIFSKSDEKPANIFGSLPTGSIFGQGTASSNIFGSSVKSDGSAPLFGSQDSSKLGQNSFLEPKSNFNIFASKPSGSLFGQTDNTPNAQKIPEENFKFKLPTPPPATQSGVKEEMERKSIDEEEKMKSEMIRKAKEEELRNILLEANKSKQEAEMKERERREAEERQRIERERKEKEEKRKLEELARIERVKKAEMVRLEELAKQEEVRRKSAADHMLKMDRTLSALKTKYRMWKAKEFFAKWRLKTWISVENRKMREYFKESQIRYPPVCTEEDLDGNPYGLIIPNILILRSCQTRKDEDELKKKRNDRIAIRDLSFVNLPEIVGRQLDYRSKRLSNKVDPFLWKMVFSVPDESECTYWKDMETFIEMNFVDKWNWQFGQEKGPLSFHEGSYSTFRYKLSVRRLRGPKLFEGSEVNEDATSGSNGLIFVIAEDGDFVVARQRLRNVIESRSPLPKIPLVILALGDECDEEKLEKLLELESWTKSHISVYYVEKSYGHRKEHLISQLIRCLSVAAQNSSPVTLLRTLKLSEFYRTNWFDLLWRRIETSLSNYKIVLKDPNFLIECYNSCIDELNKVFIDSKNDNYTVIGDEFVEKWWPRPTKSNLYKKKLSENLELLKLPPWPKEIPKSSHQLKYRIHQYCKKLFEVDKKKMKELKWVSYGIIRRSLLWKGLDIYCDEDIASILLNFPWIQLFQEFSRFVVQESIERLERINDESTVVYMLNDIEQFSYESSLITKFIRKARTKKRCSMFEEESSPCPELDSVVFAYSSALERESNKRKREECVEEGLDDLFEQAENKRQLVDDLDQDCKSSSVDIPTLKSNFQSISDKLDELTRRLDENAKFLEEFGAT